MKKYCTEIILAIILLALSLISIFVGVIDIDIKDLNKILYLIFDYPYKHYTFKYFEV